MKSSLRADGKKKHLVMRSRSLSLFQPHAITALRSNIIYFVSITLQEIQRLSTTTQHTDYVKIIGNQ